MKVKPGGVYESKVKSGAWAYNEQFDCYYDTKTLEWVEPKCPDAACEFCSKRPPMAPTSTRIKETR